MKPPGEMRVCVIGAGPAGLTTLKQLQDAGIGRLECFEKASSIGGLFNHGPDKTGVPLGFKGPSKGFREALKRALKGS